MASCLSPGTKHCLSHYLIQSCWQHSFWPQLWVAFFFLRQIFDLSHNMGTLVVSRDRPSVCIIFSSPQEGKCMLVQEIPF